MQKKNITKATALFKDRCWIENNFLHWIVKFQNPITRLVPTCAPYEELSSLKNPGVSVVAIFQKSTV